MSRRIMFAAALSLLLLPALAAAQGDKPADLAGEWEVTAETPNGTFTSTMKLERMGDQLTGRMVRRDGTEGKLNNLKLAGKTITFDRDITINDMDLHLVYTGTVDGDTIKGTFEAGGQTMNWSARRKIPGAIASGPTVAGTWKISVETPGGTRESTLILRQEGERVTGTLSGANDQVMPLEEVGLKDKELRFTVSVERNGQTRRRTYVATVDGETLKGSIEGGNQARSFSGKREAPAAARIAGTWKLSVQTPEQTYTPTLVLTEQAGKYSGVLKTQEGSEGTLKELVMKGSQIEFAVDLKVGDQELHLRFAGTLEGDRLKGAFSRDGETFTTTGERQATS